MITLRCLGKRVEVLCKSVTVKARYQHCGGGMFPCGNRGACLRLNFGKGERCPQGQRFFV